MAKGQWARQAILANLPKVMRLPWKRDEIAAIRVGPPLFSGQNVPRKALLMFLTNGETERLMEDDQGEVLLWLATVLRKALGVPAFAQLPQQQHAS